MSWLSCRRRRAMPPFARPLERAALGDQRHGQHTDRTPRRQRDIPRRPFHRSDQFHFEPRLLHHRWRSQNVRPVRPGGRRDHIAQRTGDHPGHPRRHAQPRRDTRRVRKRRDEKTIEARPLQLVGNLLRELPVNAPMRDRRDEPLAVSWWSQRKLPLESAARRRGGMATAVAHNRRLFQLTRTFLRTCSRTGELSSSAPSLPRAFCAYWRTSISSIKVQPAPDPGFT